MAAPFLEVWYIELVGWQVLNDFRWAVIPSDAQHIMLPGYYFTMTTSLTASL